MQTLAALPGPRSMLAVALLAAAALVVAYHAERAAPRVAMLTLGGIALGFIWATGMAQWRLADRLDPAWEGRDIDLVGVVASLPQVQERGVRFEFAVEHVQTPGAVVPKRILLGWYAPGTAEDPAALPPVKAGQRRALRVRLKLPHGSANPHGFDYEAWLLERGIRATGLVRPPRDTRSGTDPTLLAPFVTAPGTLIDAAREGIRERMQATLEGAAHGGVLIALAIGDQRAIDSDDWKTFMRTGVGHLMSISGLHVTMIGSLAGWLVATLWRRFARLALALPAQRAGIAAGFAAAFAYCLLAGFAVPAQRTLYMLAVAAWALWRGWFGAPTRVLAIALVLVCIIDPWAPLAPGFWLSFGAVALLLLAALPNERRHWLARAASAQVAVTLGLVPLTLALFQQVSLAGPLANAIAIPVVSFIVTPLALVAALLPVPGIATHAHEILVLLMLPLEALSALDWAIWQRGAAPMWTILLAVAGALWCLIPWWWHWRVLGLVWMLPLLVYPTARPAPGDLWLTVLDVGQGLAVVARTTHHTLLFDTGPRYTPEADSGNRIVVPYLRGEGIVRLEGMIVSHDDNDHSGGAISTMQAVVPDWLASPLPDDHPVAAVAPARRRCLAGDIWQWDGVSFEFLHPSVQDYARLGKISDNSRSCVLRITAHGRSALLPADIERDVETRLATDPERIKSTVLVVPHHGSRSSSTPDFISAVAPEIAIVAAGYRNRFRHPAPEVVERYAARGTRLLRTDQGGAVRVDFTNDGIATRTWREERPRYWTGR
ncbi:MAG: DNA internalization-related competence protein ComEC/Rec2 [Burkholderiales bacterium]